MEGNEGQEGAGQLARPRMFSVRVSAVCSRPGEGPVDLGEACVAAMTQTAAEEEARSRLFDARWATASCVAKFETQAEDNAGWINDSQALALLNYAGGDFRYLLLCRSEGEFLGELETAGDTLVQFIVRELATSEDCDSIETAVRRVETAITQLTDVRDALARAEGGCNG